jgi:hypothetical protein
MGGAGIYDQLFAFISSFLGSGLVGEEIARKEGVY